MRPPQGRDEDKTVSQPLISIVVPTYNRSRLLREAVDSVRGQTYERWELVLVDDGSTDDTAAVFAGLDDPRMRVVRLEHTGNAASVRNAGLAAARGTYVAFLDDDDLWMHSKLAVQLAGLQQSGCRWGYTAFDRIDEHGRTLIDPRVVPWRPHRGWILEQLLRIEAIVPLPTVMAERSLLEEAGGFDETFRFCEDYELWFRLAARATVHVEETPLARVRVHARNQQADREGVHAAWVRVYAKTARALGDAQLAALCRRRSAEHAVVVARAATAAGRRLEGLVALVGAGRRAAASLAWWKALARLLIPNRMMAAFREASRR
jgi:glycosyltransferase involved in cell wall biosynthesis